jgi:hypothetical protein
MTQFDFSYFPKESDLFTDINYAFQIQCKNGVVQTIESSIKTEYQTNPQYNKLDLEIDIAGIEILSSISKNKRTIKSMTEEEREALAVLWVNYMCEKPRGAIVQSVGVLMEKKVDLKSHSMDIIRAQLQEDMNDESTCLGAIMYLWTLICVSRAISKSINDSDINSLEIAPPVFKGVSLN